MCAVLAAAAFGLVSCGEAGDVPTETRKNTSSPISTESAQNPSPVSGNATPSTEASESEFTSDTGIADYVVIAIPLLRDFEDWEEKWDGALCSAHISTDGAEAAICGLQLLNAKFIADRTQASITATMDSSSPLFKGAPPEVIEQSVANAILDSIRIGSAYDDYAELDCSPDEPCASYAMAVELLVDRLADNLSTWEAYNH